MKHERLLRERSAGAKVLAVDPETVRGGASRDWSTCEWQKIRTGKKKTPKNKDKNGGWLRNDEADQSFQYPEEESLAKLLRT